MSASMVDSHRETRPERHGVAPQVLASEPTTPDNGREVAVAARNTYVRLIPNKAYAD